MLFELCRIKDTVKSTAFKVSIFNFVFATILIALKIAIAVLASFEHNFHDKYFNRNQEITRAFYLIVILNLILYPGDIALLVGVKKDRLSLLRTWMIGKMIHSAYILLINLITVVFLKEKILEIDGILLLTYTVIVEIIYVEMMVYMNNYRTFKQIQFAETPK